MKILVVDDERDIQTLFEQRFRKEIKNHEVQFEFAFSGDEALSYLDQHFQEAVLILSDVNMPGMSGLELLKKIKEKFGGPPPVVMMITAFGDDYNYSQAMKMGADDFLTKPLDFNLLKEKLKAKRERADRESRVWVEGLDAMGPAPAGLPTIAGRTTLIESLRRII